jgi:hypothetical protein
MDNFSAEAFDKFLSENSTHPTHIFMNPKWFGRVWRFTHRKYKKEQSHSTWYYSNKVLSKQGK